MKYQPPFEYGVTPAVPGIYNDNANASYVNGDPALGIEGSYFPGEALEHSMREIVEVISYFGLTPDHTDLTQLRKALMNALGRQPWIAVNSATTTAPPVSPAINDTYVVPSGASGAWSAQIGKIARYVGSVATWVYSDAPAGTMVRASDTQALYRYTGSAWVPFDNVVHGGTCTGAANTYTVALATNAVAPPAPFDGMILITEPSATNTGASTANVFGYGSKAVQLYDDTALTGNELTSGRPTAWKYKVSANGGAGAWLILPWAVANSGGTVPRGLYVKNTPGTVNWTVPAGVTRAYGICIGGGGGGGGASFSGGQPYSGGGAGGGRAEGRMEGLTPGGTVSVTVGAGGGGGTGAGGNGVAGGTSSIGAFMTAPGGGAGQGKVGAGPAGSSTGATGTGGNVTFKGGDGSGGLNGVGGGIGGNGAMGGAGGPGGSINGTGSAGTAPGGGGAGTSATSGGQAGGAGADGLIIIIY